MRLPAWVVRMRSELCFMARAMIVARDAQQSGARRALLQCRPLPGGMSMRIGFVVGLALLLAACGSAAPAAPATVPGGGTASGAKPSANRPPLNPPAKVHVAYTGAAAESATFVGYERGYFKEEGLDLDLVRVKTGQDALPSVASGQIDVFASPPQAAIYNAMARSIDLKIAGYFQVTPTIS